jgi:hypothetical protein
MPVTAKTKRPINWIEVFFFFVIAVLVLFIVTIFGLVVLNTIRPDLSDKLRVAVASKMLQEDFQSLIDDRKKLAESKDTIVASEAKIAKLQLNLEATQKKVLTAEKNAEEAKNEVVVLKKLIVDLGEINNKSTETKVVEDGVFTKKTRDVSILSASQTLEEFVTFFKVSQKTVFSGDSTADRIEIAKNEIRKFEAWVNAFNIRNSTTSFIGKLQDIEPGKNDGFVAIVQVKDLMNVDRDYFGQNTDVLRFPISSSEKAELRVGESVTIAGKLQCNILESNGLEPRTTKANSVKLWSGRCSFFSQWEIRFVFFLNDMKVKKTS